MTLWPRVYVCDDGETRRCTWPDCDLAALRPHQSSWQNWLCRRHSHGFVERRGLGQCVHCGASLKGRRGTPVARADHALLLRAGLPVEDLECGCQWATEERDAAIHSAWAERFRCKRCGIALAFPAIGFCEQRCRRTTARTDHANRRRARKARVRRVAYSRAEIFARDGYTCWICGGVIDPTAPPRCAAAPTLDHVKPICRRGPDVAENVRPAHRGCNSRKGGRPWPATVA